MVTLLQFFVYFVFASECTDGIRLLCSAELELLCQIEGSSTICHQTLNRKLMSSTKSINLLSWLTLVCFKKWTHFKVAHSSLSRPKCVFPFGKVIWVALNETYSRDLISQKFRSGSFCRICSWVSKCGHNRSTRCTSNFSKWLTVQYVPLLWFEPSDHTADGAAVKFPLVGNTWRYR